MAGTEKLFLGICENEKPEYDALAALLHNSKIECDISAFQDGVSFLQSYWPGKYDLILMDIYMNGMTGVDVLKKVRQKDPDTPAAFITTSLDHALDGYQLHVGRYLHKPLQQKDIDEVLDFALKQKQLRPAIDVKGRNGTEHVFLNEILYIEHQNRMTVIYLTSGNTIETSSKLDDLMTSLPTSLFLRCHQSYIVNLSQVKRIDEEMNVFVMANDATVYIRRTSMKQAKTAWKNFMFGSLEN
ncbi:MAG: LytTR family DNA-binding domain-containing protein [Lactimicrobium massiliense]|nr:LytTR family DNA-binding domain-containing protein [Lactimicrobium massiliense]MDD6675599.1 LytTR family DNA-binding domain-containing protein [Lactimicrobium massiliense]